MAHSYSTRDLRLLRGVVLTDGGSPVSAATVRWNNQAVCVPTPPHGTPACAPPTIIGSARTGPDQAFRADLPADTYTVCATPGGGYLLDSCEWPAPGSTSSVKLADSEDRTGIQIILRSGSLVVIRVKDPLNATSRSFSSFRVSSWERAVFPSKLRHHPAGLHVPDSEGHPGLPLF